MARHHKKGKRRRRVGGPKLNAGSPLVMAGAVAAGYFLDQFVGINNMLYGMLPGTVTAGAVNTPTATMGNIALAGELGIGGYLLLSKKKSMVKTVVGGVAVGLGVRALLKEMKVISGYQNVPVIGRRVGGYQNTPVIGRVPSALSGIPTALSGYRSAGSGVGGYTPAGSGAKVMAGVNPGVVTETGDYRNGSGYMN